MIPHRFGSSAVVVAVQAPVGGCGGFGGSDQRYSEYGLVVRADPALDAIDLEPQQTVTRNLFLTSLSDLRGSLSAACRNSDSTGRFFRFGRGPGAKVYFVRAVEAGFRTLDMDCAKVVDLSDEGMWAFLNDAHAVGGLVPLMPARMCV
ncbi:hypothetical protein [Duganella vulcania]|uniref:Uncharacterized protein n=1 Tax=Duganella vulcania TaxID=2692166 RepID=A0A845GFK9_9BURK|nr:hypothetical protein [Duganella vulcania]MYM92731.1 hypothetical protein [Duganella vulcania]